MAEHDFHEFVGAVVAEVVREMGVLAHVERLAVVERGDDVPGRAPAGHQVEGLEAPGDVERLEIGGRGGRAEAELFGRHAHAGQHHQRVHLHAADAVFDRVGVIVAVAVRHGEPVVEERHVEFAGFQDPADLLVVVRRHRIVARFRVPPGARQVGAVLRLQEADHRHLPCHAALPVPRRLKSCEIELGGQFVVACQRAQFVPGRVLDIDAGDAGAAASRGYTRPRPDRTRRWSLPRAASL